MLNLKSMALVSIMASLGISCSMAPHAGDYKIDTFRDVDMDRSGFLDNGEYQRYAWGRADWDNDGYLENTEYVKYTEIYYDTYDLEYEKLVAYDTDGDGLIDRSEFNNIPTAPIYEAWDYDKDGNISSEDWDKVTVKYLDLE